MNKVDFKIKLKTLFQYFVYLAVIAFISLVTLELAISAYVVVSPQPKAFHLQVMKVLHYRLRNLWSEPEHKKPFHPPFEVWANNNLDDAERLKRINTSAHIPPSSEWKVSDFLLQPESQNNSFYHVKSNSLGFRDPERNQKKGKNTKRIIALGSYQTFGLGLNQEETYPYLLETLLNKEQKKNKYEVWNLGRPASTAIVGWSIIKNEIKKYKPDIVILDYGFVDTIAINDDLAPSTVINDSNGFNLQKIFSNFLYLNSGRLYIGELLSRLIMRRHRNKKFDNFEQTMGRMIETLKNENVKVILLGQLHSQQPPYRHIKLAMQYDIPFVNTRRIIHMAPNPDMPMPEWVKEFRPKDMVWPKYLANILHPNQRGNRLIAEQVAKLIKAE